MKFNKFTTFKIASLSILTFSTPVLAEQSIATNGVYLGAGITPVIATGHGTAINPGASAALGYRINNHFAVETSYTGFVNAFLTGKIIDLTAKAFLPITPKLSAFGKLGGAYFRSEADFNFWFIHEHSVKSVVAPEAGAGLDYNFTPKLAAELGMAVLPVQSNIYVMPVTLGLRYTFG